MLLSVQTTNKSLEFNLKNFLYQKGEDEVSNITGDHLENEFDENDHHRRMFYDTSDHESNDTDYNADDEEDDPKTKVQVAPILMLLFKEIS